MALLPLAKLHFFIKKHNKNIKNYANDLEVSLSFNYNNVLWDSVFLISPLLPYLNYGSSVGIAREEGNVVIAQAGDYVLMQIVPTVEGGGSDSSGNM